MFQKMKNLYEMQKQAKLIRDQLRKQTVSTTSSSGILTIFMNGEQKVTSVELDPKFIEMHPKKLALEIQELINKSIQKTQKMAAEKMKELGGIPGLM